MSELGFKQRSVAIVQQPKQAIGGPLAIGFIAIVLIFGGLFGWSLFAVLATATIAPGVVMVEGQSKVIQNLDGGTVVAILVVDGDWVEERQELIRFDTRRLDDLKTMLRSQLIQSTARIGRLRAEMAGSREPEFPGSISGIPMSDEPDFLRDQISYFHARKLVRDLRRAALKSEGLQNEAVVTGVERQLSELRTRLRLSDADVAATSQLAQSGNGTSRAARDMLAVRASISGEIAGLEARRVETLERQRHNGIEVDRLNANLLDEDLNELQQVTRDQQDLIEKFHEVELNLEHATIKAPIAGQVFDISLHTIGAVVPAGTALIRIVPKDAVLNIEATIPPIEIEQVKVGARVGVRIDGEARQTLPSEAGVVTFVSADTLVDKGRGTPFFLARIKVDQTKLSSDLLATMRPGLPVEVMIAKRPQTIVSYLLAPFKAVYTRSLRE